MKNKLNVDNEIREHGNVVLVTGGFGFVGRALIHRLFGSNNATCIINLDRMSYAAAPELLDLQGNEHRYELIRGNVADRSLVTHILKEYRPEKIFHLAAESHNSNAVAGVEDFWDSNAKGSSVLYSSIASVKKETGYEPEILHMSTCEVYGDKPVDSEEKFVEEDYLNANNSYNNTKAAGDREAQNYFRNFGLKIRIMRCSNIFGSGQDPEKMIPKFTRHVLLGQQMPIYENYQNQREWTYLEDAVSAMMLILEKGKPGEIFNVTSGEKKNIMEVAQQILVCAGLPTERSPLIKIITERPGHDRGYPLDASKIRDQLGWKHQYTFEEGFLETFKWNKDNLEWLNQRMANGRIDESAWAKK